MLGEEESNMHAESTYPHKYKVIHYHSINIHARVDLLLFDWQLSSECRQPKS